MLINWFTVGAQLVNFLILVWLLHRFLYRPILQAIDQREQGIAKRLADADARKAQAETEHDDYKKKNDTFDRERAGLEKKVKDEADGERRRIVAETSKVTEALLVKRREAIAGEARDLGNDVTRWTQKEVFAIARKVLRDLSGATLEERVADEFVVQLRAMPPATKEQMAVGVRNAKNLVVVSSAFDLPAKQQTVISDAVRDVFAVDVHIRFETRPELICGIELSAGGQKSSWSIGDYFSTLEKSAVALVGKQSATAVKADSSTAVPNGRPKNVADPVAKPAVVHTPIPAGADH